MSIYIIEHLEPKIWEWCLIEYKNISKIVGKNNLWFTNIKEKSKALKELSKHGKIITKSVKDLNLKNACVLDPEAKKTLSSKEAKKFDFFIFGGILGDYPPKKRTKSELTTHLKKAKARNLGKCQFSTDNAVFVTKQIILGKELSKMKFINELTIKINDIESTILPFCYPIINKKPLISKELIKYLKSH
ncbi:MAG: SAM-dependent methyltransferase [Candidatus Pacearchaeota archaeon]|nr:SAM-dependent methyltransferase [Candidatus Pacearchaeota archaeon]